MCNDSDRSSSRSENKPQRPDLTNRGMTPDEFESLSPVQKTHTRALGQASSSAVKPDYDRADSCQSICSGRGERWAISRVPANVAALLGLLILLGFGLLCTPLPDRPPEPEPEEPLVTVVHRVMPWRDIVRFLATHGDGSLKDLNTFRTAWKEAYGERPLIIETVACSIKRGDRERRNPRPISITSRRNLIDSELGGRNQGRNPDTDGLFRIFTLFLRSEYIRNPSPEGWRCPQSGELFIGVDDEC
jgi:hypothetical protein